MCLSLTICTYWLGHMEQDMSGMVDVEGIVVCGKGR